MAATVKYYRLFELRILHEYFLLHDDKLTYFDLPLNTQQAILEKQLLQGQYKLMEHLTIEPTAECLAILKNHRMKIGRTAVGIVVAGAGKVHKRSDNSEILLPEIPLSPYLEFTFVIKVQNAYFRNYTLLPLKLNSSAIYLFSNDPDNVSGPGFASLSNPVAKFESGSLYYSGDIADHRGVLKESFADTNNNLSWENMAGSGYLNENDRCLYPSQFIYYPSETDKQNNLTFVLKDIKDKTEIKKIIFPPSERSSLRVDFSSAPFKGANVPIPNGRYLLEKDNSISSEEKEIYLLGQFSPQGSVFNAGDLGMILIRASENSATYRIMDEEGGFLQPHPIFQIRLASRSTFWRYQSKISEKKLAPKGTDSFFVDDQDNNAIDGQPYKYLITKRPQKLANLPVQTINGSGLLEVFPQPGPTPIRTKPNDSTPGRIYSDVYISTVSDKIGVVS